MKPLTAAEAAAYTGYTKAYLYRLVSAGKIPYHKPNGGRLFFNQEELEQYVYTGSVDSNRGISEKADNLLLNTKRARRKKKTVKP